VQCIAPTRRDALLQIVHLFPLLGSDVPVRTVRQLHHVLSEYRLGCINDKALPVCLKRIQAVRPLVYDLLQVCVDLCKLHTRIRLITLLPAHMLEGQMMSTRKSFPQLVDTEHGLYDSSEFAWCSVCGAIYSMGSETTRAGISTVSVTSTSSSSTPGTKIYVHGHRDVIVDYDTDYIYCWQDRTTHVGRCRDTPLLRLPMFGVLLKHEQKYYMVCPQPDCGMPMVLDVVHCAFTAYGPCCMTCTRRRGVSDAAAWTTLAQQLLATEVQCVVCDMKLSQPHSKYMYGAGLYVCSRHHCAALASHIARSLTHTREVAPDASQEVIQQGVRRELRAWNAQHTKPDRKQQATSIIRRQLAIYKKQQQTSS
jgi:hypothetical protein